MFVRVKRIRSRRYVYLVRGIVEHGKTRQRTVCYLGPITRLAFGVPENVRKKAERYVRRVDWPSVNMKIRTIPLTFEEMDEAKRGQMAATLKMRLGGSRRGRGNKPRVEGELKALAAMSKRSFDKMFDVVNGAYVMR